MVLPNRCLKATGIDSSPLFSKSIAVGFSIKIYCVGFILRNLLPLASALKSKVDKV